MELVVNFSGGKDSCAMLAYLCDHYPEIKKHVVFADTGWEHPDAEEWSREIVKVFFGLPLHVVRNPNKTFLTMVERRGMFPGMQQRQCTSDLKRGPIQTWIRNNITGKKYRPVIVNCMGLRSEESPARKKRAKLSKSNMSNSKRHVYDWLPIKDWTEVQVLAYLAAKGIPLHPVYKYLRRFSCRVCIYMSQHDLQLVQEHDPQAIAIVDRLEKQIGFTMFQAGSIKSLIN